MGYMHIEIPVTKCAPEVGVEEKVITSNGVQYLLSNYQWCNDNSGVGTISICHSVIDSMFDVGDCTEGVFILTDDMLSETWPVKLKWMNTDYLVLVEVGEVHTKKEKMKYIPFMGASVYGLSVSTSRHIMKHYPEVRSKLLNLQMILL